MKGRPWNERGYTRCEPCNKWSYSSRKMAMRYAGKQRLRLYECPVGNGFHLGHRAVDKAPRGRYPGQTFNGSVEDMFALAAQLREES